MYHDVRYMREKKRQGGQWWDWVNFRHMIAKVPPFLYIFSSGAFAQHMSFCIKHKVFKIFIENSFLPMFISLLVLMIIYFIPLLTVKLVWLGFVFWFFVSIFTKLLLYPTFSGNHMPLAYPTVAETLLFDTLGPIWQILKSLEPSESRISADRYIWGSGISNDSKTHHISPKMSENKVWPTVGHVRVMNFQRTSN